MQVCAPAARGKRHAAHAELTFRIDAIRINAGGAACRQNDMRTAYSSQLAGMRIQAQQSADAVLICQDSKYQRMIQNRYVSSAHTSFKFFGHIPARQRSRRGRSASGIVICLIADILPHFVAGKRHTELNQLKKAPCRACRLA